MFLISGLIVLIRFEFVHRPYLKRCSRCQEAFYCSKECQTNDWKYFHYEECKMFRSLSPLFLNFLWDDFGSRLALRLIFLLNKFPEKEHQLFPTHNGERNFASLMHHTEEFYKNRQANKDALLVWTFSMPYIRTSLDRLKEIRSKVTTNSFAIDMGFDPVGYGLYIATSVFDHSCIPNASQIFDGLKMQVRAIKSFDTEIEDPVISYIDLVSIDREQDLRARYFFTCQCPRCLNMNDRQYMDLIFQVKLAENELIDAMHNEDMDPRRALDAGLKYLQVYRKHWPWPDQAITRLYGHLADLCRTLGDNRCWLFVSKFKESLKITHGEKHSLALTMCKVLWLPIPLQKSLQLKAIGLKDNIL